MININILKTAQLVIDKEIAELIKMKKGLIEIL